MSQLPYIINGGWHISYFGDASFIRNKLINFSHQEFNTDTYTNLTTIEEKIKTKTELFDDSKFLHIPIHKNTNLPPLHDIFFGLNGDLKSVFPM